MIHKQFVLLSTVALLLPVLFTSAPASAAGNPCPTEHGSCFDADLAGAPFGLFDGGDNDSDGDTDYLEAYMDGVNDFLTVLPNGKVRFHLVNHEVALVYCPDMFNPDDSCVVGMGRASGNGTFGGLTGACPGRFTMSGTGERISDGVVFELSGDFQVKASDCDSLHKWFITAEEVD